MLFCYEAPQMKSRKCQKRRRTTTVLLLNLRQRVREACRLDLSTVILLLQGPAHLRKSRGKRATERAGPQSEGKERSAALSDKPLTKNAPTLNVKRPRPRGDTTLHLHLHRKNEGEMNRSEKKSEGGTTRAEKKSEVETTRAEKKREGGG